MNTQQESETEVVNRRYLTKSGFRLATECPTKLFYTGKPEYANQELDDKFLLALAEGGFQVGELAKRYFPDGHEIKAQDYQEAIAETKKLLKLEEVIIFEAAIATNTLLIRSDIIVKNGNQLNLYEVKAKSFNSRKGESFVNQDGTLKSSWTKHLYDVAFQKYVINQAFPQYTVSAYLMMPDKSAICPTDGLNQKFRVVKNANGRKSILVSEDLNEADLEPTILCEVNVDNECEIIYSNNDSNSIQLESFKKRVDFYADQYVSDTKIISPISPICSSCQFHTINKVETSGLLSGKKECWKESLGWSETDFDCPTVIDVWNLSAEKKSEKIKAGRIKMSDLTIADINIQPRRDGKSGLSMSGRQWLQIEKLKNKDASIWLDRANLKIEMDSWKFPLHFIDFETAMAAIPFNAGQSPYEGIAFQFSHHIVDENGKIEHFGQFLNTERGVFPNYDFVRELMRQLNNDQGSIFCYSNHENTFLNTIYRQISTDKRIIDDRAALCHFIKTISRSVNNSSVRWTGQREMIDLWDIVKRYYYDPATNGSNSIKHVLPAILNSSTFLQDKYSKSIYGSVNGIPSLNYKDWKWVKINNGKVTDPYSLLPKLFQNISVRDDEILSKNCDEINNGGAALIAYGMMQFEEMTDYERAEIQNALLKYCELDTLAMAMLYEGLKDLI